MKYCTKCGNKLNEENKFCSKCGTPTRIELERREEEKKRAKELKKDKALLYLGSGLIILASIIFAFSNWENMSNIFKIVFLTVEMVIFLSISVFSKKIGENMPYKATWFIGILFVPIILNLIGDYGILGNYLSYKGAGIFVYLSISSVICALVYYLSYKYINSKLFIYAGHIFSYLTIVFLLSKQYEFLNYIDGLILSVINLIIVVLCTLIKNKFTKTVNSFISVVLLIFSFMLLCSSFIGNTIIYLVICLVTTITILLYMKLNNKNGLIYVYPFILHLLVFICSETLLDISSSIFIFTSVVLTIALHFIFNLYNNKSIKEISFILMNLCLFATVIFESYSDKVALVLSIIFMVSSIFIYKINDEGFDKKVCRVLFPLILLMFISSLIRIFKEIDYSIIYMAISIICFSIYTILSNKGNKKLSLSFGYFAYIILAFSSIQIFSSKMRDFILILFIINEIVWMFYLISGMFTKKMISKNIILLIAVILNLFIGAIKFDMPLYYLLLFISVIFILLDIVSIKFKIKGERVYFYISLAAIVLATIFEFNGYNIFGVCINTLVYAGLYYILVRRKVPFVIKYIYTLFGFCLISRLFNYFIDQHVIANIIILIVYILIIISMFLLETDSDERVLSYTPVIIFPYSYLINNIDIFYDLDTELMILLLVTLILIFMEKVFKFTKDKDRTLVEIILISIIHVFTLYTNVIFNVLMSIFYIFFGLFKKKDLFVILGIVFMIISVFTKLFEIVDNLSITYIILGIGVILVTYVFITEARKNNKK